MNALLEIPGQKSLQKSEIEGMNRIPTHIDATLQALREKDALRQLRILPSGMADFSSNDYLGLARARGNAGEELLWGAGGSRLLSGNHPVHEALEKMVAAYFHAEAALVFSSGYMANIGLLSAIATRHDTFIYDQAIHASMKDGMRLSLAQSVPFRHNDLLQLEELISKASGNVFVLTEGLFSMDGDSPDLHALCGIVERTNAFLVVDEAHSTGIFGGQGEGRVVSEGLESKVFARVHTFGKAAGRAGAAVLGSSRLIEFLINRARAFIYTTAMPNTEAAQLMAGLELMRDAQNERVALRGNIQELHSSIQVHLPGYKPLDAFSPILPWVVEGNAAVKAAAQEAQKRGLDLRPILSPTVKEGTERLRVVLHSFNTIQEIRALGDFLGKLRP